LRKKSFVLARFGKKGGEVSEGKGDKRRGSPQGTGQKEPSPAAAKGGRSDKKKYGRCASRTQGRKSNAEKKGNSLDLPGLSREKEKAFGTGRGDRVTRGGKKRYEKSGGGKGDRLVRRG